MLFHIIWFDSYQVIFSRTDIILIFYLIKRTKLLSLYKIYYLHVSVKVEIWSRGERDEIVLFHESRASASFTKWKYFNFRAILRWVIFVLYQSYIVLSISKDVFFLVLSTKHTFLPQKTWRFDSFPAHVHKRQMRYVPACFVMWH